MFYAMRENDEGFYVSIHEEDGLQAIDTSPVCSTIEAADVEFHKAIGFRLEWQAPDEDADRDVRLIGRG